MTDRDRTVAAGDGGDRADDGRRCPKLEASGGDREFIRLNPYLQDERSPSWYFAFFPLFSLPGLCQQPLILSISELESKSNSRASSCGYQFSRIVTDVSRKENAKRVSSDQRTCLCSIIPK